MRRPRARAARARTRSARPGQVRRAGEPVVPGAYDKRIEADEASSSTAPSVPAMKSNSSCPATSGGEICTTGSPRSSARQIRPRSKSALLLANALDQPLALHDLDVLERHRALHRMAAEGHAVRVHRAGLREG